MNYLFLKSDCDLLYKSACLPYKTFEILPPPRALYWHYFRKSLTTGFWAWNLFIGIPTSALPPLPFFSQFRFPSKRKGPHGKCCELDRFLPGHSPAHEASFPTGRVHTRLSAVWADKARWRIYPAVGPTPGRGWHSKQTNKRKQHKTKQKNSCLGLSIARSFSNHDTTFSYCSRCILLWTSHFIMHEAKKD